MAFDQGGALPQDQNLDIPPEFALNLLEGLNQNSYLVPPTHTSQPQSHSSYSSLTPTIPSSVASIAPSAFNIPSPSPTTPYYSPSGRNQKPSYPEQTSQSPTSTSETSGQRSAPPSVDGMDVDEAKETTNPRPARGNRSNAKARRRMFDAVVLYDLAKWLDDIHFTLQELPWDFKTMNNWGFYVNTSLGVGRWYHSWVIPNEGPVFRRGNREQVGELIVQQGPPPVHPSSPAPVNGRPKIRVPAWRSSMGLDHLHITGAPPRVFSSRKRARVESTRPMKKPQLSVSTLFDPVGVAHVKNRVTLIGTGFNYGPTQVLFGNNPAEVNFVSENGDVIVCLTPESPPSKVWVDVMNGKTSSRYEIVQYEFKDPKPPKSTPPAAAVDLSVVKSEAFGWDGSDSFGYEYKDNGLFSAASFGDVPMLMELADDSGQLSTFNAQDSHGATALFWAVWGGHLEAASYLLGNGALPNMSTDAGESPLHMAADNEDIGMIEMLISYGAEVNIMTLDGETPLFYGASNPAVVDRLIEFAADIGCKNARGETFRDWSLSTRSLRAELKITALSKRNRAVNSLRKSSERPQKRHSYLLTLALRPSVLMAQFSFTGSLSATTDAASPPTPAPKGQASKEQNEEDVSFRSTPLRLFTSRPAYSSYSHTQCLP
eukprot:TRINITY_DN563_c0_g1_i1.p1 TRINITY_DN563_c0_g1~~TRINITY_DN563_c0_g1_i1.p1  ORF type:complete len:675 (+),score=118.95 TRINITY_DN563_c0_g1_i1:60-2027(+)